MILIRRHHVTHAEQGQGINEKVEKLETVRKIAAFVKAAVKRKRNEKAVRPIEKVNEQPHTLKLRSEHTKKQEQPLSGFIRIQLEEIKRKVRIASPAALQFIGPGDHRKNPPTERRDLAFTAV